MSNKVRIGFVGCGGNGRGHLKTLSQMENVQVVGVCDVQETLAQAAAEETDSKAYTDFSRMLDENELDAVYLSVPPFVHGEMEFALIERGIPFYVEKPVTLDVKLGCKIAEAIKAKNLLTAVGYQIRYRASTAAAREVLSGATIGLVSGYYWCGTGRVLMDRWWSDRSKSGGQLVEQATHTLDSMIYLAGEIDEVICYEAQRQFTADQTDVPDVTTLMLRFKSGAIGTLSCVSSLNEKDGNANIIDITCDDNWLRWTGASAELTHAGEKSALSAEARFANADEAFIHAVQTNDASAILADYSSGLYTAAVSLAAAESARTSSPVRIDEFLKC